MSLGLVLLLLLAVLIFFGLAQRILDRMRLNDIQALVIIVVMVAGSFVNLPLTWGRLSLSVNIGGALVPIGLAVYLIVKADENWEKIRAILAALGTTAAIWLISSRTDFGPEAGSFMFIDSIWLYSMVAGVLAYLLGRSRRAAFVAGTLGIVLADILNVIQLSRGGLPGVVILGGAGVFDATVLAGFIGVALAELVGESRERLQGGPRLGADRPLALRQDEGVAEEDTGGEDS